MRDKKRLAKRFGRVNASATTPSFSTAYSAEPESIKVSDNDF